VLLRWYLRTAFWVFALSFFAQAFAPRETAAASVWGFAPGWQREIGFFDLAMALMALLAIRADELRFQRSLALAIVVLTTLVGTNHLITILSGDTSSLHEVFVVVNYAAVAIGSMALFSSHSN
jgi:KinB signaling pathway activation protein